MTATVRRVFGACCLALITGSGCVQPRVQRTFGAQSPDYVRRKLEELTAARHKWDSQQLSSYSYRWTIVCYCRPRSSFYTVNVINGSVVSVVDADGVPVALVAQDSPWQTIDQLFAEMQEYLPTRAEYDSVLGYPTLLEIGTIANDSGFMLSITDLSPKSPEDFENRYKRLHRVFDADRVYFTSTGRDPSLSCVASGPATADRRGGCTALI